MQHPLVLQLLLLLLLNNNTALAWTTHEVIGRKQQPNSTRRRRRRWNHVSSSSSSLLGSFNNRPDDDDGRNDDPDVPPAHMQQELQDLQYQLSLIQALEERNRAQLDSFVDAAQQWESLSPDEKALLTSKAALEQRCDTIMMELVNSWVGRKSVDG